MDIGKSFTFPFEDEGWLTKILVGGLFSFLCIILIGVPFVIGYYVETLKNVYQGNPKPLPNWGDNLGGLFSKGLKAAVGFLIWSAPAWLLSCVLGGILGLASGSSQSSQDGIIATLTLCLNCVTGLYSLIIYALLPAALMRFSVTEDLSAFFQFNELFRFISKNLGNYIIALIVYWLATVVGAFGILLCFVGVFLTSFWSMLVGAHLFGQVYRASDAV